jgi:release factor glutamine methyltransferase
MTIAEALHHAQSAYTITLNHMRILLGYVLKKTPEYIFSYPEKEIFKENFDQFITLCCELEKGKPLSRIIGIREFWSLPFQLSEATLDPRPDSETLIEAVLDHRKDKSKDLRILDLGTGTGCLVLSLLHEYKNATGIGIDLNPKAVETAALNATNLNLATRAIFQQGSWFDGVNEKFDLIISNPPYITPDDYKTLDNTVRNYDPKLALVADNNGLACYEKIISNAKNYLKPDGILVLEIGFGQKDAVSALLSQNGFDHYKSRQDLAGIDRCLIGLLGEK